MKQRPGRIDKSGRSMDRAVPKVTGYENGGFIRN